MRARRQRLEAGATVVEAAFAIPILLMFIFGLIDLGMWTFNSNQATNAAKDGARAAIVGHTGPDDKGVDETGSVAWNRAVGRIERKIDRDLGADDVTIECETPDGDPVDCVDAVVDVDRVRVEVEWTWSLVTPVAAIIGVNEGEASGVATMTIIGKPTGTPVEVDPVDPDPPDEEEEEPDPEPTPCEINGEVKVGHNKGSNSQIIAHANEQLKDDIWVGFTTNGVQRCNGLAVQITTPSPHESLRSMVCESCELAAEHAWKFVPGNEKIWATGDAQLRIYNEFHSFDYTFGVNQ